MLSSKQKQNKSFLIFLSASIAAGSMIAYVLGTRHSKVRRFLGMTAIPPLARKRTQKVTFGKVAGEDRGPNPMDPPKIIEDPYFWMRDDKRQNKQVLNHIKGENAYTEEMTSHLKDFREELYQEFISHYKETDSKVPYKHGPYFYYSRTEKGKSYSIYCRSTSVGEKEEVILDVNKVAEGQKYCDVGSWEPEPVGHNILAYAVDYNGSETYEIHFVDLRNGQIMEEKIPGTGGSMEWGKDDTLVFYTTLDDAHRPHKLWRHKMGTSVDMDELLFTETDEKFRVHIGKTDSGRFLIMYTGGAESTESHFVDLESEDGSLKIIQPRLPNTRYSIEHWGDEFFIVTNINGCMESKLVRTPVSRPGVDNWVDVYPYDKHKKLSSLKCFSNHLVLSGRSEGLPRWWIIDPHNLQEPPSFIELPEPTYSTWSENNKVFDTTAFRFGYSSFVTPNSVFDYDLNTREMKCLKVQEIPLYDRSKYVSERLFATARDGTKIPLCFVYRKDLYPQGVGNGPMPLHLYGYGSYGISIDPSFGFTRLSYLDRGVVWCTAQIRGGGEMGRYWYEEQGKYLTKKNTFNDFCDCAEFLIKKGWTTREKLAICGRSAGGLLIGAVVNMRPDLCKVAVADVPFVDIMNTMCDPAIPLTVTEWEQWGNPNEEKYFQYMREYSPYDNVSKQDYPFILFTGGLNDPRVPYWEPCKLAAKLRSMKTNNNPVLVKIDMDSGHFSASDRYHYLRESAFEFAVVLDQIQAKELKP